MKACPGLRSRIASRLVTPTPKLVFPAKAGIQKGRGWENVALGLVPSIGRAYNLPWSHQPASGNCHLADAAVATNVPQS